MFSVFSCLGSQEIHQLEAQKCESEVINLSCYVMDITDLTWGQNPVTVGLSTKLCSFFDGMNLINLHDSHFETVLNGRIQDITTIVFTILGTNFLFHQILVRPRRHVVAFEGACHHSGRSTESSAVSKKLRGSHFIFPKNDPTIYLILILNPVGKQVNEDKSGVALWISFSSIPMFKTFHNFWNVLKIIWSFMVFPRSPSCFQWKEQESTFDSIIPLLQHVWGISFAATGAGTFLSYHQFKKYLLVFRWFSCKKKRQIGWCSPATFTTADIFGEGDVSQAQVHAQFRAIVFSKKLFPLKEQQVFIQKLDGSFLNITFLNVTFL